MTHKVYINGKMVPEAGASVSVFDRSYLYGEGVFETMRAYNAKPAFCDMHYHRLKENCAKLKIELPLNEYAFEHAVVKTLNTNKIKDAFVRVTISPVGVSMGIARPPKMTTNLVIFVKHFKSKPQELYSKGAKLVIIESVYPDDPEMAEIKSTNYLTKMLARSEVVGKKADEGLFLSRDGVILEATSANIFVVINGRIFTPPLSDGCLPGVTRWVVMGLAEQLKIPCKESSLTLDDLEGVEEIFLTGSTSEVLPVREIVGVAKKSPAPGPVTKQLMRAYKELVYSKM